MSDDEIQARYIELFQHSQDPLDFASEMILGDLFDYQMVESYARSDSSKNALAMSGISLHEMFYPGLSEAGIRILGAAVKTESNEELEDMNYSARLREKQCDEARIDDAFQAANALSDVEEAVFERKLQRYMAVYTSLSLEDQERVRKHNSEHYGIELPSVPRGGRDIQLTLATEFPDRYLEEYLASCEDALANRGRPFRKVVSRTGPGCGRTSSGGQMPPDGAVPEHIASCWTEISFTQEPEESSPEQSNTDGTSE